MLNVTSYLKDNSLEKLQEEFFIKISRHGDHPNLVLLKYSQIDSPKTNPVVMECRGIILDENDNWNIVAFPYKRFFNYGEIEIDFDWNGAKVYEKLDGSLVTLYFYKGKWHIATSGTADAGGAVFEMGLTFKSLFWDVWNKLNYSLPKNRDYCYMFELMTQKNQVVVFHKADNIVLHGARNLRTLTEVSPENIAAENGWACAKVLPLNSIKAVLAAAKQLEEEDSVEEGFVLCDNNFSRIKVKSLKYVRLAHLKSGLSAKNILASIVAGETAEFLLYFPEYKDLYKKYEKAYCGLVAEIESKYSSIKHIEDKKEFALQAKDYLFSGVLFAKHGKNLSVEEGLKKINIKKIEEYINKQVI